MEIAICLADQDFDRTKSLGIFNVALRLTEHLAVHPDVARVVVLSNLSVERRLTLPSDAECIRYDEAIQGRLSRTLWDQRGVYRAAAETGCNWLVLPKGYASFLQRPPCNLATFIHDAAHEHYKEKHPEAFSMLEGWYFRRSMLASIRHSRVIFTQSEFSRQEVMRVARNNGLSEPRVVVAGVGFPAATAAESRGRADVLLLVSRFPHKRSAMAIEYLARWQRESGFKSNIHLVGALPAGAALPSGAGWRQDVRLPDDAYTRAMREASVVIYSSEYEGFGMPPVEAALAGACPVFSDLEVTREVMGEAGFRFTNGDYASFAAAMNHALQTSPETIASWASELSRHHDWNLVTYRIVDALREANAR